MIEDIKIQNFLLKKGLLEANDKILTFKPTILSNNKKFIDHIKNAIKNNPNKQIVAVLEDEYCNRYDLINILQKKNIPYMLWNCDFD